MFPIRAGPRLKFRWGGFSNHKAVRWAGLDLGGAGHAKRAEKFFPPHGRFVRWGGKFPPFNTENTGKTGFMPANFVNCYP